MTFQDFLNAVLAKNPHIAAQPPEAKMTLTRATFEAQLARAYEAGFDNGKKSASSLFDRVFGSR